MAKHLSRSVTTARWGNEMLLVLLDAFWGLVYSGTCVGCLKLLVSLGFRNFPGSTCWVPAYIT